MLHRLSLSEAAVAAKYEYYLEKHDYLDTYYLTLFFFWRWGGMLRIRMCLKFDCLVGDYCIECLSLVCSWIVLRHVMPLKRTVLEHKLPG